MRHAVVRGLRHVVVRGLRHAVLRGLRNAVVRSLRPCGAAGSSAGWAVQKGNRQRGERGVCSPRCLVAPSREVCPRGQRTGDAVVPVGGDWSVDQHFIAVVRPPSTIQRPCTRSTRISSSQRVGVFGGSALLPFESTVVAFFVS
jgi:hypothetical protein